MENERFNRSEADDLDKKIIERLGARQEKLDRMAEMEQTARRAKLRPMAVVMAIAGLVVVAFLLTPLWRTTVSPLEELGIGAPAMENYRAATPEANEIAQLIEAKDYTKALTLAEKALSASDVKLEELDYALAAAEDEAMEYEAEAERAYNSELRWTYIYLLVQTGDRKEAKSQIRKYLKSPFSGEHAQEAEALKKIL